MFALFEAKGADARTGRVRRHLNIRIAAVLMAAGLLSACIPATTPLAGRDPADPAAKVAPSAYRSAIAPYASLRPVSPARWRERSDDVAPQPDR
jgi:hypothetical protein